MAMNFYCETDESQMGKSAIVLNPTPGLSLFGTVPNTQQIRSEWTINGRSFAVADGELVEMLANGTINVLGNVANDQNLSSMCASPLQLAVASGGFLYVYYLKTIGTVPAGTFIQVPSATFPGPVAQVALADDIFIALITSTDQYFSSTPLDATMWPGLDFNAISTFPDNVVSMIVDHRQVVLLGQKSTEFDYNIGSVPEPFGAAPGGFAEEGCAAADATVQLDNSVFWIGSRNDRGQGIGWRFNGYVPTRVTNHAVEFAWSQYPTISDARGFAYQEGGHSFWHINFPSANATWVLDVSTGLWHQRGFWNAQSGLFSAALPQCHTFNFGKHLVGDRQSGNIYQMGVPVAAMGGGFNFVTDNGNPIRRVRRAPHISTENQWIKHASLWVDMETGLAPMPPLLDGMGNPREPSITLRYSDDGGHTWSGGADRGCGLAGNYRKRVIWRRLGRSRDRVYEISCSDPIPYRIVDAYLQASGFQPKKRLPKELSEAA
jgi:hypothetical protein